MPIITLVGGQVKPAVATTGQAPQTQPPAIFRRCWVVNVSPLTPGVGNPDVTAVGAARPQPRRVLCAAMSATLVNVQTVNRTRSVEQARRCVVDGQRGCGT